MANPPCMSGDGNAAAFIGTFLETGDTVALCDECLVAWSAAMLNAMTGIDPAPFIAAISDDVPVFEPSEDERGEGAAAAANVAAPPTPSPPPAGRTRRTGAAAGTAVDHSEATDQTMNGKATPAA